MGQFVEFLDEKGRFMDLRYCIDAQDSPYATSHQYSTMRMEKATKLNCYDNLRLLALAQDMCEDFGMELYITKGTLEKQIDERQLWIGFDS